MKKIAVLIFALLVPHFARAQTAQLFYAFTATVTGGVADTSLAPQVDALNVRISGISTTASWTAQIQTSPDNSTWTSCGSLVTATSGASSSGGACTPSGAAYTRVLVTAGSGGGSVVGALIGTCSLCQVASSGGITLTTTGTSGAATLIGGVLNIPIYAGGGSVDTRPIQTTSVEYITVNRLSSYTFSSSPTSPSTAGTATYIHFTLGPTSDGLTVAQNSTITIACDGDTENVSAGMFFAGRDAPIPFWTDQIGNTVGNTLNTKNSMNRRLEINYSTGCTFTFNNASAVSAVTLFGEVQYRVGTNVSRASRQHWHAYELPLTQVAQYAVLPLLPTISAADGGEAESMSLWVTAGANFAYEEGDPSVTTDGNVAITANGTEDFFGCGYNCINGKGGMQLSKWGQFYSSGFGSGPGLQSPAAPYDGSLYRFFSVMDPDNVLFTNSLAAAWPNGSSGEFEPPGIVNARTLVTWWTKDPMAAPVTYSTPGGQISLPATITLASATSGAKICSTTDGTAPIGNGAGGCTHGTLGTSVVVSAATNIQAIATASGFADSEITSQFYAPTQSVGFIAGNTAQTSATSTSLTSAAITFNAGDHAIIFCRASGTLGAQLSVTSSVAGNTVIGIGLVTPGGSGMGEIFYVDQMVGGSTTFTCTSNPTQTFLGMAVLDYGAGTTHANVAVGAEISTATLSPVTTTFSTTAPGLIVACFDPHFAASTLTAGTIGVATATARAASVNFQCEDVVTGSAQTSITATMVATGTAGAWDYGVMTFQ